MADGRPGRPKRADELNRTLWEKFKVSPVEREKLEEMAKAAGFTKSEYIRRKALGLG
jgi:hypothetical protein